MIAFGCSISEPEPYHRYAERGITRAAEPDSVWLPFASAGTPGRSLNVILDEAARLEGLEALVIVHPHVQLDDPGVCAKVRAALSHPGVELVGCAGARNVRTAAWWDGELIVGDVVHRYLEHGGGEMPAFAWATRGAPPAWPERGGTPAPPALVEVVDPGLMVLSPWAVRHLRFDEALPFGYGAELDFCLQVEAAGRSAAVNGLRVVLHRPLELFSSAEIWVEAHVALSRKWGSRLSGRPPALSDPADEDAWRGRARLAEAERESARAEAYSRRLIHDARVAGLERQLQEIETSRSWGLTLPLREANLWLRRRRSLAERPPDLRP